MKVKNWMTSDVITMQTEDSTKEAWHKIINHHIRQLPVLQGSELVGIVSRTDLLGLAQNWEGTSPKFQTRIKQSMTYDPATIVPSAPLEQAASRMFDKRLSSLVVTKDQELVGILTKSDVLRALTKITGFQNSVRRAEYHESSLDQCITRLQEVPDDLSPKSFIAFENEEKKNWTLLIHHARPQTSKDK